MYYQWAIIGMKLSMLPTWLWLGTMDRMLQQQMPKAKKNELKLVKGKKKKS